MHKPAKFGSFNFISINNFSEYDLQNILKHLEFSKGFFQNLVSEVNAKWKGAELH